MSISLEIVPLADSIEMVGTPDRTSAYSLAGHVAISLRSTSSYFDRTRMPARMLLESLTLTFEGQSELLVPTTGYHPFRLCAESHDITPSGEPVELTNEGLEDMDQPCTWNAVFSIPIPGWLPASAQFGDELNGAQAGIAYTLYASAKFVVMDDSASTRSFFSFANLCSAFTSRLRTVNAPRRDITVTRVVEVPSSCADSLQDSLFNRIAYTATPLAHCAPEGRNDETCIPLDVLEKIRFRAEVPEHAAIDEESSLPFTLKFSAEGMSEDMCSRFQITGFTADIEQTERYRSQCSSTYSTAYPVPSRSQQAQRVPLRNPHPLHALYDMSICLTGEVSHSSTHSFSLRSPDKRGEYALAGNHYVFSKDADPALAAADDASTRSFGVNASLPFASEMDDESALQAKEVNRLGWTATHRLRPTGESPHLSVRHHLRVSVQCAWDAAPASGQDGEPRRIHERLDFITPLSFVHIRPAPALCPPSPEQLAALGSPIPPISISSLDLMLPSPSMPYADSKPFASLPPYSQLFDSNGDRRIEYDLPKYEALPTTDTILIF